MSKIAALIAALAVTPAFGQTFPAFPEPQSTEPQYPLLAECLWGYFYREPAFRPYAAAHFANYMTAETMEIIHNYEPDEVHAELDRVDPEGKMYVTQAIRKCLKRLDP